MFCSECGAAVNPETNYCMNCGAPMAGGNRGQHMPVARVTSASNADMINRVLLGMGVFMAIATFMSWYRISVNMGDAPVDALANFITRLLPSYSGVSTYYGVAALAVALVAVILTVCRSYMWAVAVGLAGAVLAVTAMFLTPDFVALNSSVGGGGRSDVMEMLQSNVLSGMFPSEVRRGAAIASTVLETIYDYVAVKSCFGLTVYALTSAAFAVLSWVAGRRRS